jgi:formamidopyrimidine-DNA glycosylase
VALIYAGPVPELPEVEIAARRLARTLAGVEVESALALGMVALKSVKPPLDAIVGMRVSGVRRVGKMPVVELGHGSDPELELLVHLMSAGRLQVFDKRASLRDRASRVLIRLADGRELRLREFGTKQRAWAKLLEAGAASRRACRRARSAATPPPAAPRPADDRRHRSLLGRRDPLGGEALALQEGIRAR